MRQILKEELMEAVQGRAENALIDMREAVLKDMDLSGLDMKQIDFSNATFENVCLERANLSGCNFKNAWFENSPLRGAVLQDANLESCMLRKADMRECDIRGANLFFSILEKANLKGIISDERTQHFRMNCPEKGPFLAYKKCCDDRIVELLVPADAKRSSSTLNTCRCSKAKVLVIKSIDCSEYYDEAWALADENFVYRRGKWVEVPDFDEDRWNDSTRGIHIWMTREEAIAY
ncbi:MAG: pentapeptide repeat-containing protein [Muricomes sp.]